MLGGRDVWQYNDAIRGFGDDTAPSQRGEDVQHEEEPPEEKPNVPVSTAKKVTNPIYRTDSRGWCNISRTTLAAVSTNALSCVWSGTKGWHQANF